MTVVEAAIEAARIRLRPILMTSLAFILGVLPLVVATGAGQVARQSVGTTVAGGMFVSTFLNLLFIPVLYVVVQTLRGTVRRRRAPARGRRAGRRPDGRAGAAGTSASRSVQGVGTMAEPARVACENRRILCGPACGNGSIS